MTFQKGNRLAAHRNSPGGERPPSMSLRQLRMRGEEYSQEMLAIIVSVARGERPEAMQRKDANGETYIELVVKGADMARAAKDVLEFTHGKAGPRNDDAGLPEGWLSWPREQKLAWAKDMALKAAQLIAVLEGEAG